MTKRQRKKFKKKNFHKKYFYSKVLWRTIKAIKKVALKGPCKEVYQFDKPECDMSYHIAKAISRYLDIPMDKFTVEKGIDSKDFIHTYKIRSTETVKREIVDIILEGDSNYDF